MFHCANCWFERWRGRSLSDSQHSYNSDVVSMREQVCSSEKVQCGSARSTAGDDGSSDTRTTHRLYHSITKENIDRQWLSESLDLGSLCWLIFGGKSTECSCRPYGWLGLDGNRCIRVIPRQATPYLFL